MQYRNTKGISLMVRQLRSRQTGVFTIEFALVASIIAMFLVFISDVVGKQSMHGHLQRLSYSGVNVIKERTQLYTPELYPDEYVEISNIQAKQLFQLLQNSMQRTMSGFNSSAFGMHLEQVLFEDNDLNKPVPTPVKQRGMACVPKQKLESMSDLFLETSWENAAPLYRVTLCYKSDNWFGSLVDTEFTTVSASSIMIGRLKVICEFVMKYSSPKASRQQGASVIMFLIMIPVLIGFMVLSIEGGRYLRTKSAVADATEVAALAISARASLNEQSNQQLAENYIQTLLPEARDISVSISRKECSEIDDCNPDWGGDSQHLFNTTCQPMQHLIAGFQNLKIMALHLIRK